MSTQLSVTHEVNAAYLDVLAESSPNNWALFTYAASSNELKVAGTGDGGLEELSEEWEDSKIQYAFCKVIEPISKLPKFVLISWCGDGVPVSKKGLFHHHVNDLTRYFNKFHVHINARAELDVTPEAIMKKVQASAGAKYGIHDEKPRAPDTVAPGSVYEPVRTNPRSMTTAPATYSRPAAQPPRPPAVVQSPAFTSSYTSRDTSSRDASSEIQAARDRERREQEDRDRERERQEAADRERNERQRREREDREREEREREDRARREREDRQREDQARREREDRDREDRARRERENREREERDRQEREAQREREDRARREADERARMEEEASERAASSTAIPNAEFGSNSLTAVALYAYQAQEENEIDFDEGETIKNIEQLDEGWWQGVNASGKLGLFPANYVELTAAVAANDSAAAAAPASNVGLSEPGKQAVALYDYEAAEENELSFSAGDLITNIMFLSDDWWQGTVNDREGLFPGNYVELQN